MSERGRGAVSRYAEPAREESGWSLSSPFGALLEEVDARSARIPTRLNEYGYDRFGLDPRVSRYLSAPMVWAYRHYLRVEARGIERVPAGRVLLIANHGGNTFAWDGAMLATAMLLEAEPPRIVRGMAEYFLPTIPFFNVFLHRCGSVVGTPENCVHMLENEECVVAFPEGVRGMNKLFKERYQLQRFGNGFMRLALETNTPIVPVAVVGGEEQYINLGNSKRLAEMFRMPVFPVIPQWLVPGGQLPLPTKYRIYFGEPLRPEGEPHEEDAVIERRVDAVKAAMHELLQRGLEERSGIFS